MNTEKLFSTKERIRILKNTLFKTSALSVSRIAKEAHVSKALVSQFFEILKKEKLINKEKKSLFVNNTLQVKTIKIFLTLQDIKSGEFKKFSFVRSVGVYGSATKGTNTEDSDIDVWVYCNKAKEENHAKLTYALKAIHNSIKILFLTKKKLERMKEDDPLFYHALVFGSITIYGDDLENV